jgi:magnesium-transporting ATPase (P-type)
MPTDLFGFGVSEEFMLRSSGIVMTFDEQTRIVNMAMTAFYATLIMCQFVHVFVIKTRFVPMLEHGIFNNSMMNYGVMVELGIMIAIIFIPSLNTAFSAYGKQPVQFFFFFLVGGALLIGWGELRKFLIRTYPTSGFANAFAF